MNDNLGAILNYVNYDAELLTSENKSIYNASPLNSETDVSIVIPVFNEGGDYSISNIKRTLTDILNQVDLTETRIKKYELIIVNNCSTDNTIEIINEIVAFADIPILVINESRQGYEYALKYGFDFAVRRFLDREIKHGSLSNNKVKFKTYTLVSTDADPTEISRLWLYRIRELMSDECIDCFGGPMPLSKMDKNKYPNIEMIIDRYINLTGKLWDIFGGQTPGANMGLRPYWYSLIGGVKRVFDLPFAMDVYMGDKIMTLGGKAAMLPDDGYVCFNLRRVLENPMKWFAGKTYDEGMKNIRDNDLNGDLPNSMIEEAWRIRKGNTINLFFQLVLLKPNVLFTSDKQIEYFFESKSYFEDFKNTVISLLNTPIFEAKEILSSKYQKQIEQSI